MNFKHIGGLRVSVDEIGKITNGLDSATITKIWTVTFNSQIHPTTYGDLPMLVWDESNNYLSYKDDGQYRPQVFIREQMKGTRGNNRQDGNDLSSINVELVHRTVADIKIGRYGNKV